MGSSKRGPRTADREGRGRSRALEFHISREPGGPRCEVIITQGHSALAPLSAAQGERLETLFAGASTSVPSSNEPVAPATAPSSFARDFTFECPD
jgi:hypothetical protein